MAIIALVGGAVLLGSGRGNVVDKMDRLGSMSLGHLWAGVFCLGVGVAEEVSFCGLLQTRMIEQTMGPLDALLSSLSVLPPSLFFGFMMIRTRNVLAPVVLHAFMNWQVTLNG